VGIADARGELRATTRVPAVRGDARASLVRAFAAIDELSARSGLPRQRLQGVGVCVPGVVDASLGALVEELLSVPAVITNVAGAGAVAEVRAGVARGVRSFVWVHVGGGLGAGIVIDGQPFHGHSGGSGEIGHLVLASDGPACACGRRGCLEALASAPAIVRAAEQAVASGEKTVLANSARRDVLDVARAALAGDEVAGRIVASAGEYLGVGVGFLMSLLNPEMVVLGGMEGEALEVLVAPLRAAVQRHAPKLEGVTIAVSSLGERAPLAGAVLAATELGVRSYRVVATGLGR
jgi:predicted NBD/HSP70 family sugar kinase